MKGQNDKKTLYIEPHMVLNTSKPTYINLFTMGLLRLHQGQNPFNHAYIGYIDGYMLQYFLLYQTQSVGGSI